MKKLNTFLNSPFDFTFVISSALAGGKIKSLSILKRSKTGFCVRFCDCVGSTGTMLGEGSGEVPVGGGGKVNIKLPELDCNL